MHDNYLGVGLQILTTVAAAVWIVASNSAKLSNVQGSVDEIKESVEKIRDRVSGLEIQQAKLEATCSERHGG